MAKKNEDWSKDESRSDTVLNLKTVQKMLPLVRGIVSEVITRQHAMAGLQSHDERLHRVRRNLTWGQRKERYLLQSDIADHDRALDDAKEELRQLGLVLLDANDGRVGFPTLVNNRPAFFTWTPGEDAPHTWQFAEDNVARPIPPAWLQELSVSASKPV